MVRHITMNKPNIFERNNNYSKFFERIQNIKYSSVKVSKPVCDEYITEYKELMKRKRRLYELESTKETSLTEHYIY